MILGGVLKVFGGGGLVPSEKLLSLSIPYVRHRKLPPGIYQEYNRKASRGMNECVLARLPNTDDTTQCAQDRASSTPRSVASAAMNVNKPVGVCVCPKLLLVNISVVSGGVSWCLRGCYQQGEVRGKAA